MRHIDHTRVSLSALQYNEKGFPWAYKHLVTEKPYGKRRPSWARKTSQTLYLAQRPLPVVSEKWKDQHQRLTLAMMLSVKGREVGLRQTKNPALVITLSWLRHDGFLHKIQIDSGTWESQFLKLHRVSFCETVWKMDLYSARYYQMQGDSPARNLRSKAGITQTYIAIA